MGQRVAQVIRVIKDRMEKMESKAYKVSQDLLGTKGPQVLLGLRVSLEKMVTRE